MAANPTAHQGNFNFIRAPCASEVGKFMPPTHELQPTEGQSDG